MHTESTNSHTPPRRPPTIVIHGTSGVLTAPQLNAAKHAPSHTLASTYTHSRCMKDLACCWRAGPELGQTTASELCVGIRHSTHRTSPSTESLPLPSHPFALYTKRVRDGSEGSACPGGLRAPDAGVWPPLPLLHMGRVLQCRPPLLLVRRVGVSPVDSL